MATWRLSHLIAVEDGPVDVFKRWKLAMGAVKPVNGPWTSAHWWGKFWICPLCLSIWIAPAVIYLYLYVDWFYWVAVALAVSGASSWLELIVKGSIWGPHTKHN